jgi:bla regulator protein BlaR1
VDQTGLTDNFDIELAYEDEDFRRRFPGIGQPREAPSLFTALREQLGLRLMPSRGLVDVLVIDSVERPTPD